MLQQEPGLPGAQGGGVRKSPNKPAAGDVISGTHRKHNDMEALTMKMWRKKHPQEPNQLNMTAMCDVVFQLLIFLILTAVPPMVVCTIDTMRPQANPRAPVGGDGSKLQLRVLEDAYVVDGKRVNAEELRNVLLQLARIDRNQAITIACAPGSSHGSLIRLLDMCGESGLSNFSLLSM
jgi:biopolymer transport protein ExbD